MLVEIEKVSGVSPGRDMYDTVLVLGEQVEPPCLAVNRMALLLALAATAGSSCRCAAPRLVGKVGTKCIEAVHHCQRLQHIGRVRALRPGQRDLQLAGLGGDRAEVASVVRAVGSLEDGRHCELRGVCEQAHRAGRAPHADTLQRILERPRT